MTQRAVYRISEACALLGICRATLYRRAAKGEIEILKWGSMSFVKCEGVERIVAAILTSQSMPLPIPAAEIDSDTLRRNETRARSRRKQIQLVRKEHETDSDVLRHE